MLPSPASPPRVRPVRARAVLLGLAAQCLAFAWVADSEIRQSVYLICYSLLMPAVVALVAILGWNALVRSIAPGLVVTAHDQVVVYVMLTASLPIAGFGALRFVLPTLGLPFYRTTADDWSRFTWLLPAWLAPQSPGAWRAFFRGGAVPWAEWAAPLLFWGALLLALAGAWLCLAVLLRRRWVEAERLTFPIAAIPLRMIGAPRAFFSSPLMWLGFAVPAVMQSLLALNHLYPSIPAMQLKAWDAGIFITSPPWNAVGYLPIGLYPSAVGLAFLVPTDVSLSCWVFYLLTKLLNVAGAAAGMDVTGQSQAAVRFPYPQEQAAGAWLALGAIALIGLRGEGTRRAPWAGLAACLAVALALTAAAGVPPVAAGLMLGAGVLYVVCGARVRAEVGAQWTFAPLVWTPTQLTLSALGSGSLGARGQGMTSLLEAVNVDVRGQGLPNHLESLRIGAGVAMGTAPLVRVMLLATVTGLVLAAVTTLWAWHDVGAGTAKANAYALTKSQIVWQNLSRHAANPAEPDAEGLTAVAAGAGVTVALARARLASVGWPLHPIGYVLANTLTVNAFWVPFMGAWLVKALVRRYGGMRVYARSVDFALGLVLGDILAQSGWTLAGRALGFPVYQFLS